jgi:hypothetical protein
MPGQSNNLPKGSDFRPPAQGWADSQEMQQVWRLLRNIRSGDESRITVRYSGGGIVITPVEITGKTKRITPGGAGGGIAAKVRSKVTNNHYKIDLYENGAFDDTGAPVGLTQSTKDLFILQIDNNSVLPNNTWVQVTKVGEHYETTVPLWL